MPANPRQWRVSTGEKEQGAMPYMGQGEICDCGPNLEVGFWWGGLKKGKMGLERVKIAPWRCLANKNPLVGKGGWMVID